MTPERSAQEILAQLEADRDGCTNMAECRATGRPWWCECWADAEYAVAALREAGFDLDHTYEPAGNLSWTGGEQQLYRRRGAQSIFDSPEVS